MRLIYVIRNFVSNKVYVGQTKNLAQRKAGHLSAMRKGLCRPLYASMRKHGVENFSFEILEECADDQINERERHWVTHFDSLNPEKGYNLTSGGNQNFEISEETRLKLRQLHIGLRHSIETRQKISKIRKGQKLCPHSDETKKKISQAHRGKRLSEEHRRKLSESARGNTNSRGKRRSEVTKKKISDSQLLPDNPRRGRKRSEETKQKMRDAWVRRRADKLDAFHDT